MSESAKTDSLGAAKTLGLHLDEHVADVLVRIVERRTESLLQGGFDLGAGPAVSGDGSVAVPAESPGAEFLEALRAQRGNAIIAEVKMGSPKLGDLREKVDFRRQSRIYAEGRAAALSVVVEPDHFFGSYDILEECVRVSGLPAIAKDFVVSVEQFRWARDAGANAVLLIAALYEASQLRDYAQRAVDMGLVPLIETHTQADLAKLVDPSDVSSFDLVGINNRDLRTFEVDIENSLLLRPSIPMGALAVAESGLSGRAEIVRLAEAGFDAFLIGESLLLAKDPASKLEALRGNGEDFA